VKDDEIAAELKSLTSSEQACRRLLDLALERGGSDNITVLIARVKNLD
jgi:protein phosphatase